MQKRQSSVTATDESVKVKTEIKSELREDNASDVWSSSERKYFDIFVSQQPKIQEK